MQQNKHKNKKTLFRRVKDNWQPYLFLLPTLVYFAVFHYAVMYGVQIAFKKYVAIKGIWGSEWVGFQHFSRLFTNYQFPSLLRNTVLLSVENLLIGFPIPIIFALLLNQIKNRKFRKTIQTVTYAPYFLSTIVVVSILNALTGLDSGFINYILNALGHEKILFMGDSAWFRPLYIITEVWQKTGWDSIIYIAALASVSPELHEAAMVDGANKPQRIWHIDLPALIPTIVVLFILRCGQIMKLGFEKAYLMQNSLNLDTSEIISTYVYKMGVQQAQYSFASAAELFNSVINVALILCVNTISSKASNTSLW